MNQLERLEQSYVTEAAPFFEIGDTVRVKVRVVEARASGKKKSQEEEKERIQIFEGLVPVAIRQGRKERQQCAAEVAGRLLGQFGRQIVDGEHDRAVALESVDRPLGDVVDVDRIARCGGLDGGLDRAVDVTRDIGDDP